MGGADGHDEEGVCAGEGGEDSRALGEVGVGEASPFADGEGAGDEVKTVSPAVVRVDESRWELDGPTGGVAEDRSALRTHDHHQGRRGPFARADGGPAASSDAGRGNAVGRCLIDPAGDVTPSDRQSRWCGAAP